MVVIAYRPATREPNYRLINTTSTVLLTTAAISVMAIVSVISPTADEMLKAAADTSFIASRGGWLYCDDSRVQPTDAAEVVVCTKLLLFRALLTIHLSPGASCICLVL